LLIVICQLLTNFVT